MADFNDVMRMKDYKLSGSRNYKRETGRGIGVHLSCKKITYQKDMKQDIICCHHMYPENTDEDGSRK